MKISRTVCIAVKLYAVLLGVGGHEAGHHVTTVAHHAIEAIDFDNSRKEKGERQ